MENNKKGILIVVGLVVVVGIIWLANSGGAPKQESPANQAPAAEEKPTTQKLPSTTAPKPSTGTTSGTASKSIRIVYSNGIFSPNNVTVKIGQTVTFVNQHSSPIQVASDPHPLHTSYSTLNLAPLSPGGAYTTGFILSPALQTETIRFHNHFFPQATGMITVKR